MFNPLRLLRRKNYIDDTETAFIEGRATEQDEAALRERETREPGLRADLESIRQTVSLLRSVETAKAPRSFALSHAPVRVPRQQRSRQRLAMAPAVFAIAAAVAVGLLAVGNLTNVVHQSDDSRGARHSESSTANSSNDAAALSRGSEADGGYGIVGPQGEPGIPGLPGEPGTSGWADAQRVPSAAATSTPAPYGTQNSSFSGGTPEIGAVPPTVETSAATAVPPSASLPTPDVDSQTTLTGPAATPVEEKIGEDGLFADGTPQPLPQSTITSASVNGDLEFSVLNTEQQAGGEVTPDSGDRSGVGLPLWQLQMGFAVFAVLMAGAWFLLQRRLTA